MDKTIPKIKVKGTMDKISKEELRAILHASACILEYHNLNLNFNVNTITVHCVTREWLNQSSVKKNVRGKARWQERKIWISKDLDLQGVITTGLHEMIHIYLNFEYGTTEKCTSTLTARLKDDVARIYPILVENTYKRASYIAHTKISYPPNLEIEKDYYDRDQNKRTNVKEIKKYRRSRDDWINLKEVE